MASNSNPSSNRKSEERGVYGRQDSSAADGPFSPVGLKVLVVDDDPMCLRVVSAMLQRCNYEVETRNNGEDALKLLRERQENGGQFDLVLSDVYMPDMDGFKLLESIGLELEVPVIMMSSDGDTNVVLRGVTHGAVDFLIKPVRIEELRNVWQHVVRRKSVHLGRPGDEGADFDGDSRTYGGASGASGHGMKRKDAEPLRVEHEGGGGGKKPRVVWSVEMHQQFVNAVNALGIDKAVPKRILDLMNVEGLTRENVASHLQKYRLYLKRVEGVAAGKNGKGGGGKMPRPPAVVAAAAGGGGNAEDGEYAGFVAGTHTATHNHSNAFGADVVVPPGPTEGFAGDTSLSPEATAAVQAAAAAAAAAGYQQGAAAGAAAAAAAAAAGYPPPHMAAWQQHQQHLAMHAAAAGGAAAGSSLPPPPYAAAPYGGMHHGHGHHRPSPPAAYGLPGAGGVVGGHHSPYGGSAALPAATAYVAAAAAGSHGSSVLASSQAAALPHPSNHHSHAHHHHHHSSTGAAVDPSGYASGSNAGNGSTHGSNFGANGGGFHGHNPNAGNGNGSGRDSPDTVPLPLSGGGGAAGGGGDLHHFPMHHHHNNHNNQQHDPFIPPVPSGVAHDSLLACSLGGDVVGGDVGGLLSPPMEVEGIQIQGLGVGDSHHAHKEDPEGEFINMFIQGMEGMQGPGAGTATRH